MTTTIPRSRTYAPRNAHARCTRPGCGITPTAETPSTQVVNYVKEMKMIVRIEKREVTPMRGFGFVICSTGVYALVWCWSIDIEWGDGL
mgnify:CR=1 FL=1